MKREEILDKIMFDYYEHFSTGDLEEYEKIVTQFISENKELSDDEFFKKIDEHLGVATVFNKMLSRMYLAKIASSVNIIKVIVIIYFIASIIGAFILAVQ